MISPRYFYIASRSNDILPVDPPWWSNHRHRFKCSGCNHLLPDVRDIDVVVSRSPASIRGLAILNGVLKTGLDYAHRSLFESLGQKVCEEHIKFGRLLDPQGNIYRDYRTFLPKHRIIVRGGRRREGAIQFFHGFCNVCGEPDYSMGPEPHYVLRKDVEKWPIHWSTFHCLIFSEDIYRKFIDARFPQRLHHGEMPVRDDPVDGWDAELRKPVKLAEGVQQPGAPRKKKSFEELARAIILDDEPAEDAGLRRGVQKVQKGSPANKDRKGSKAARTPRVRIARKALEKFIATPGSFRCLDDSGKVVDEVPVKHLAPPVRGAPDFESVEERTGVPVPVDLQEVLKTWSRLDLFFHKDRGVPCALRLFSTREMIRSTQSWRRQMLSILNEEADSTDQSLEEIREEWIPGVLIIGEHAPWGDPIGIHFSPEEKSGDSPVLLFDHETLSPHPADARPIANGIADLLHQLEKDPVAFFEDTAIRPFPLFSLNAAKVVWSVKRGE